MWTDHRARGGGKSVCWRMGGIETSRGRWFQSEFSSVVWLRMSANGVRTPCVTCTVCDVVCGGDSLTDSRATHQ